MRHFPVFMDLRNRRVIVVGDGETAIAKLRLLLKTEAQVAVFSADPADRIRSWEQAGLLKVISREVTLEDVADAALIYAASDDPERDTHTAKLAKEAGVLLNVVDNLEASEFITPAIVDRDPVTIAIGTEGTAPVLARKLKAEIEETLPGELGFLARIGERFRSKASTLPHGSPRRRFWTRFFFEDGPVALKRGGVDGVENALEQLHAESSDESPQAGRVFLMGAGPGDPDLLTVKARRILLDADVVIHDRLVSGQVLEIARREAVIVETGKKGFGAAWKQEDINALMVEHASAGSKVVRLKSGDPVVFGRLDEEMDALDAADIAWEIVPGITAASAAAASLGVSLTKRQRNSALQIITGHDIKGFAEHDWRTLAKEGSVAAIYMGLKSSKFLGARLLMHGASPETPISIVENVSRPDQKITGLTLAELSLAARDSNGPVILLLGVEPREAAGRAKQIVEINSLKVGAR